MIDNYEVWIWDEFLAFDVRKPDFGVEKYLRTLGFTPDVISLFPLFPAFVHEHNGIDNTPLDYRFCAMYGRAGGQTWTKRQLKGLIDELHGKDIDVYFTFFTFTRGGFSGEHGLVDEWVEQEHPELLTIDRTGRTIYAVNMLKSMRDGTPYEDFFSDKLAKTMLDYGFDGFNGADGWSGLRGYLESVDYSDDMLKQFERSKGIKIPVDTDENRNGVKGEREDKALWIWRNHRFEWIEFYSDRWAQFWKKLADKLHATGKKAVTHDAWWRCPTDALLTYGFDYRKIAEAGVDAMVVQTVSCAIAREWYPRGPFNEKSDVHGMVSTLMMDRACVPSLKLVGLCGVHDGYERWNARKDARNLIEREIVSHATTWYLDKDGYRRCLDGFFLCFGDNIPKTDWRWVKKRWDFAYSFNPVKTSEPVLLWPAGSILPRFERGIWDSHTPFCRLISHGLPTRTIASLSEVDRIRAETFILINPTGLKGEDIKKIVEMHEKGKAFVVVGDVDDERLMKMLRISRAEPIKVYKCRSVRETESAMVVDSDQVGPDNAHDVTSLGKELVAFVDKSGKPVRTLLTVTDRTVYLRWYEEIPEAALSACIDAINQIINNPATSEVTLKATLTAQERARPRGFLSNKRGLHSLTNKDGTIYIFAENPEPAHYIHTGISLKNIEVKNIETPEWYPLDAWPQIKLENPNFIVTLGPDVVLPIKVILKDR